MSIILGETKEEDRVQGKPGLHSETLSQTITTKIRQSNKTVSDCCLNDVSPVLQASLQCLILSHPSLLEVTDFIQGPTQQLSVRPDSKRCLPESRALYQIRAWQVRPVNQTPTHCLSIYSSFWATVAELSSCNRECAACKAQNAYYLALYRRSLPTSALNPSETSFLGNENRKE
jgi:hypothetical protein